MKIFNDGNGWNSKVNFVDSNNVFVGYDMAQDCCEHADFFFSREIPTEINQNKVEHDSLDLENYAFNTAFLKENGLSDLDKGGSVTFLLENGEEELYLTIFNSHNGYYGHGFEFKIGDDVIKEGTL